MRLSDISTPALAALLMMASASCGDDPKLVEKREQQKAEITRLKGEIALIDEKLKNLPPDVTSQLVDAKAAAEKQAAEVAALEREVGDLDARKRALEKEFDTYRVKYPVK
jgi:cell division protein FtsB